MTDPAITLDNLRDIVVPPAPPLWPPAPGALALLLLVVALLLAAGLWLWRRRAANAYRRAGLELLRDAQTVRDVDVALKRVALTVFPRPQVAPLWGDDWTSFLDTTCSGTRFALLETGDLDDAAPAERRAQAKRWIRRHRAPRAGEKS